MFPKRRTKRTESIIIENGSVFDTLREIKVLVNETLYQTKNIAQHLKGRTLLETITNVFNFQYQHIQYREDDPNKEQIHEPLRIWEDRKQGIDCDDYSIFTSSILMNLGIPHSLRMTKYTRDWQHVYIVVPKNKSGLITTRNTYYVIDPVTDKADFEVPFTQKYDKMLLGQPLERLSGLTHTQDYTSLYGGYGSEFKNLGNNDFGNEFADFEDNGSLSGLGQTHTAAQVFVKFTDSLKRVYQNTLQAAMDNPAAIPPEKREYFVDNLLKILDAWDDPAKRWAAIDAYDVWGDDNDVEEVQQLNGLFKRFKKWTKKAVRNVGNAVKKGVKAVVKAAKKIGKFILRFNPLSILIRAGLRLAFSVNLFKMSEKLGWGYFTERQAASQGIEKSVWEKHRKTLNKVRGLIVDGLQAREGNLKDWILKGFNKKHNVDFPLSEIGKDNGREEKLPTIKNKINLDSLVKNKGAAAQNVSQSIPRPSRPAPRVAKPISRGIFSRFGRRFRPNGVNGLGATETAAASGFVATVVAFLSQIKEVLGFLPKEQRDKIDALVKGGMSPKEAKRKVRAEYKADKKEARAEKKFDRGIKREVKREERGGTRFDVAKKKLLNNSLVQGQLKKLSNGKVLAKIQGKEVEVDKKDIGVDAATGQPFVKAGAITRDPETTKAGISPVMVVGFGLLIAGAIVYGNQNSTEKKKAA